MLKAVVLTKNKFIETIVSNKVVSLKFGNSRVNYLLVKFKLVSN